MSFKKKIYEKSGGIQIGINIYECDKCGGEIHESHIKLNIKDRHICDGCLWKIVKEYIVENHVGVTMYAVAALIERYRSKRKSIPKSVRQMIFRKYKSYCPKCGEINPAKLTIDHIIPFIKGGSDDPENLRILCRSCNSKKGVFIENA